MPKKINKKVENETQPPSVEPVKGKSKRVKKMKAKTPKTTPVKSKSKSPVKKEKVKRAPSKFALYMRENYDKVKSLPNKERLTALSKMYKEQSKPAETGIVVNAKKE